jgi:hypothetical protein
MPSIFYFTFITFRIFSSLKGYHCLLDVTPNAVDHLNYAQYFPIVIHLKADSRQHVKELRQKYAKNFKAKSSKRLYETSIKIQAFYSHLFTANVSLDSANWFRKVKDTIDSQQYQPLWVSEDLEYPNQSVNSRNEAKHSLYYQFKNQFNNNNIYTQLAPMQHIHSSYKPRTNFLKQPTATNFNNLTQSNCGSFDENFEFPIYNSNAAFYATNGAGGDYNDSESDYGACDTTTSNTINGGGGGHDIISRPHSVFSSNRMKLESNNNYNRQMMKSAGSYHFTKSNGYNLNDSQYINQANNSNPNECLVQAQPQLQRQQQMSRV